MRQFFLSPRQRIVVDQVIRTLDPTQRNSFEISLGTKLSLNARRGWGNSVTDELLGVLIDKTLRELQSAA